MTTVGGFADAADPEDIAALFLAVAGQPRNAHDIALSGPAWTVWRSQGRALASAWRSDALLSEIFKACLAEGHVRKADCLELCLTGNYRPVSRAQFKAVFANRARGRIGIEIRCNGYRKRIAPTRTIATNRRFEKQLELAAEETGLTGEQILDRGGVRAFDAHQFLIFPGVQPHALRLYRGNRIVPPGFATFDGLKLTLDGLAEWLLANLGEDGRMTYKFWPSRGCESDADNTIRQFMATLALTRLAVARQDAALAEAAARNLRFNLDRFYQKVGDYGAIVWRGQAKLGAMALAALAILEQQQAGHPGAGAHAEVFQALAAGVDALWQDDGSFRTFLVPSERNDNQNFYPGEALLFWASWHRASRDRQLAEKCRQSFRFYRDWHLRNPNPAFVPWHSQAYAILFQDLGEHMFAQFVLERNDWLIGMQQWGAPLDEDLWGRFYDPRHPEYGPPHASSTGVYMEGLADAWGLARTLGDEERAAAYATALKRALRSIRQLQFADADVDAFYVQQKPRVMGGVRTETYDNEIRVDNVQHALMALLKIEAMPEFPW